MLDEIVHHIGTVGCVKIATGIVMDISVLFVVRFIVNILRDLVVS